jgi:hypothetical protein
MPANIYEKNVDAAFRVFDVTEEETLDIENACIKKFDDFTGKALDSTNVWTVAGVNSGTAAINVQAGGVMRVTTGGADTDDVDVASEIIFDPTKGLVIEGRIALNDVDKLGMFFGFSDAQGEAADLIAMTFATVTLTSTASNAVGFLLAAAATSNVVRGVSVNGDTDGDIHASSVTPVDAAFHTYRVELDKDRTARWYLDGDLIGTTLLAVASTALLCGYLGVINSGEAAANTVDVDYIRIAQIER